LRYQPSRTRPASTRCTRTWNSVAISQAAPTLTFVPCVTESTGTGEGSVSVARGFATANRLALAENRRLPRPPSVTTVPTGTALTSDGWKGITNSEMLVLRAPRIVGAVAAPFAKQR